MDTNVPQFGAKVPGAAYRDRPGVYAIALDTQGRIAVVQIGNAYFLPGGGVEIGESPGETLAREGLEECGCALRPIREIGSAIQHLTTSSGRHIAKQCRYFVATFASAPWSPPLEENAVLCWMKPAEAVASLTLEADVWAVSRAQSVI
jgi:8-oxo-dGTP diphosphatase